MQGLYIEVYCTVDDHPSYLCCPDVLTMVGDPLSENGCGSPNPYSFNYFFFTCCFIYSIYS